MQDPAYWIVDKDQYCRHQRRCGAGAAIHDQEVDPPAATSFTNGVTTVGKTIGITLALATARLR